MSDLKNCWVVQGNSGEYSDRCEWVVRVFMNEEKAKAFTESLLDFVRGSQTWSHEKRYNFKHPLDSDCRIDYTGCDYTYYLAEIDLDE